MPGECESRQDHDMSPEAIAEHAACDGGWTMGCREDAEVTRAALPVAGRGPAGEAWGVGRGTGVSGARGGGGCVADVWPRLRILSVMASHR